eukprot:Pgem_evm1s10144
MMGPISFFQTTVLLLFVNCILNTCYSGKDGKHHGKDVKPKKEKKSNRRQARSSIGRGIANNAIMITTPNT